MSQNDDRTKLVRLADALMRDILAVPEDEIVAEIDFAGITQARSIFVEVKRNIANQLLMRAKGELGTWRSTKSRKDVSLGRASVREQFEKLRGGDPQLDRKITLAARNGKQPTDADVDGLIEDWVDLQRFDGEGTLE
jgi:hypothetical protein